MLSVLSFPDSQDFSNKHHLRIFLRGLSRHLFFTNEVKGDLRLAVVLGSVFCLPKVSQIAFSFAFFSSFELNTSPKLAIDLIHQGLIWRINFFSY